MKKSPTPNPNTSPRKPHKKRSALVDPFEQEDEFLDEDDLAAIVGVNRRAFHDDDE